MRYLAILLLGIVFVTTIYTVNNIYKAKIDEINSYGQQNIKNAVAWRVGKEVIDSGVMDDISLFTVDYLYLGSTTGDGVQNLKEFEDAISYDYNQLKNITDTTGYSYAIFIDNRLVFIDGGSVSYDGKNQPYAVILIPHIVWLFIYYDIYVIYDLQKANFQDAKFGEIEYASRDPSSLGINLPKMPNCIYVVGTKGKGAICYASVQKIPYIVETQNKGYRGYAVYVYFGEEREVSSNA